jgi:membrane protease YdiL (CAAX protease family)
MIFHLFPILIIVGMKRDVKSYGFTKDKWQFGIDIAMSIFLFALIPYFLGVVLLFFLGWELLDPFGALTITGLWVVAAYLILKTIKKREIDEEINIKKTQSNLVVILILLFIPIVLGLIFNQLSSLLISTIIWQFLVSGFGEEFKYRGYYQSTINREFGCPYCIGGIQFGIGLIFSSLLFSFSHILNPFNPFLGNFELALWWGTFTLVSGFVFGLLREKTQSLIAPTIFHGLVGAVGEGIALIFGLI